MGGELILLNSSLLLGYEMGCWGGGGEGEGGGGATVSCAVRSGSILSRLWMKS